MKKQNPATKALFKAIVYIALIVMTISIIIPVAWVFMASFKRNAEFIGKGTNPWALPEQLQWQNYVTAFVDAEMGKFFLNSVIVTALSLVILLVIALPAAYALSRFDFKGKKILNIAFMAGLFVNINYIVVPIFLMLSGANRMLGVEFFLDNRLILSIIYASSSLSFSIYLLSGYFKTLPKGYEEAAYMLGASPSKTFFKVILPEISPALLTGFGLAFARGIGEYGSVIYISGNSAKEHTQVVSYVIMQKLNYIDYASATAIALVMLIISFLILLIINIIQMRQAKRTM